MKVLLLSYRGNPYCGGQGIYIYNLCKELASLGVEVDVVTGPPYPESLHPWACLHKLENLNMWAIKTKDFSMQKLFRIFSPWNFLDYILTRFHIFPEMQTFSLRSFFYIKKLLKTKRYDIIHDVNTLGWGLLLMKFYNIPIISTIHHPLTKDREADLMRDKTLWDKLTTLLFYPIVMQKFVINRIDKVITSFGEGVNELNRAFNVNKKKVTVVYNGMDIHLFQNTGCKREENSILFVGNTEDYKKGIEYLLQALVLLPVYVKLTIVDEGPPLKENAWSYIEKLGLEDRVVFTGKVSNEELVELYSEKSILVMSSLYEGFGLPAVEAMSCMTPVVATRVGALSEVVTEETGILVDPYNPKQLKDAICMLIKDNALRIKMGKAGRAHVLKHFSWQAATSNTLIVYNNVMESYKDKKGCK